MFEKIITFWKKVYFFQNLKVIGAVSFLNSNTVVPTDASPFKNDFSRYIFIYMWCSYLLLYKVHYTTN